jgi:GT2 family glycosyltransferase
VTVRTCAVVVKHHDVEDTVACVASLAASETPVKTIVVDNTPQDEWLDKALADYTGVEVLHPQRNRGFAGGCNLGIGWALAQTGCEFVLLLHEDVRMQPDTLAMLEGAMDERSQAGMATCRVVFADDPQKLFYARGRVDWLRGRGSTPGFGGDAFTEKALRGGFVSFAPACTMLFRRKILETIGELDESFFLYEDGVDVSQTVVEAGYRIYYCPDTFVLHRARVHCRARGWENGGPERDALVFYQVKNSIVNARKHAHGRHLAEFAVCYPFFTLLHTLGIVRDRGLHAFVPVWRGVVAGLKQPL